ncbi:MAG: protein-L-isoaspartate(D-aspartate) O-methyltransferase [Solirubrobacteraceae bacterium]|nr:protein-L-isoaspartate(D-aspartate) O-methyltransferase [Solirubrobacteraceae bacterium]
MEPREELLDVLRGEVADERVLEAVAAVPREAFVPAAARSAAYENRPLPIGEDQTISQPLVVARMCELLEIRPGDRVLDVGTGSGYHAAVLARLGARVTGIERHAALAEGARAALRAAGFADVEVRTGDGSRGLPDAAPFDAINVAAAGSERDLEALEAQLAPGGRLVAPIRTASGGQRLIVARRPAGGGPLTHERHERVRFVPLVREP